jgi:hypothetical protein
LNIGPTELTSALDKRILKPLALEIVYYLVWRRLTNIDDGVAFEVLRRNLSHRSPLDRSVRRFLFLRRTLLLEEASSAAPTLPFVAVATVRPSVMF